MQVGYCAGQVDRGDCGSVMVETGRRDGCIDMIVITICGGVHTRDWLMFPISRAMFVKYQGPEYTTWKLDIHSVYVL